MRAGNGSGRSKERRPYTSGCRRLRDLFRPQVANVVFGGLTSELGQQKFAELGFGCVLYANAALQKVSQDVLAALKREGSLASVSDSLAGFAVRQQTVAKPKYDELERRYRR